MYTCTTCLSLSLYIYIYIYIYIGMPLLGCPGFGLLVVTVCWLQLQWLQLWWLRSAGPMKYILTAHGEALNTISSASEVKAEKHSQMANENDLY